MRRVARRRGQSQSFAHWDHVLSPLAARTEVEGTAAELNFSFIPGVTEHTIHVRGAFGTATADLEHNTYTLDRLTPYSTEFDRFVRVRRRGVGLAAQAGTNVCRHVLSKLKLSRYGNAYGASIAASVAEFYHLVRDGRADGRIAPRFATEVVAAAETIGRLGVRASPEQIVVPPPVASPGSACRPRVLVLGGSGFIGRELVARLLGEGHDVRVLARKPSTSLLDLSPPHLEIVAGDLRQSDDLRRGARRNRTRVPPRPPGGQNLEGVPGAGCRPDAAGRHALSSSRNQTADLHGDDRFALPRPLLRNRHIFPPPSRRATLVGPRPRASPP